MVRRSAIGTHLRPRHGGRGEEASRLRDSDVDRPTPWKRVQRGPMPRWRRSRTVRCGVRRVRRTPRTGSGCRRPTPHGCRSVSPSRRLSLWPPTGSATRVRRGNVVFEAADGCDRRCRDASPSWSPMSADPCGRSLGGQECRQRRIPRDGGRESGGDVGIGSGRRLGRPLSAAASDQDLGPLTTNSTNRSPWASRRSRPFGVPVSAS
jgi:hypothetical protein